jgi:hypothetical protein
LGGKLGSRRFNSSHVQTDLMNESNKY